MEAIANAYRLSPPQRNVWLNHRGDGEGVLQFRASIRIEGVLDEALLEKTLAFLTQKYEILRTKFVHVPDLIPPLQTIEENPGVRLIKPGQSEETTDSNPSGVRFQLRGHGREHWLDLHLPLMCMDRVGLQSLTAEMARLYALSGEEPPPRGEEDQPLQYVDLSEWMHDLLASEETEAGRKYWLAQDLAVNWGNPLPLTRKKDQGAAASGRFNPKSLEKELDPSSHQNLLALARDLSVPPADVVLACWILTLYRSGMRSPLAVGCTMDGRGHGDLAAVPGLFARTIPVITTLEDRLSFRDLVGRVAEQKNRAAKWQDFFTWESAAPDFAMAPDQAGGEGPAFAALAFQFVSAEAPTGSAPVFTLEPLRIYLERFNLFLAFYETGRLELAYEPGMFSAESAKRLLDRLLVVLTQAPANPGTHIHELPLMPRQERRLVVEALHQPAVAYDRDLCFHHHFSNLAQRHPHKPAVLSAEGKLTFGELDRRANGLAVELQARGIRRGDRVALYMDRSPAMVISLLAVLKTGAVFVPVDPAFPQARSQYIFADCQAKLVLTLKRHREGLSLPPSTLLTVDVAQKPVLEDFSAVGDAQDLVYVIYTSGTTGFPKGVCISHRALMNYLFGVLERLRLKETDVLTTFATVAADLGHTALFGALGSGRSYRILPDALRLDADGLATELAHQGVDFLKIVPSHLNMLLTGAHSQNILPNHCLALGGEACDPVLVRRIRELAPTCRIINHYGPTETTIGITTHELDVSDAAGGPVPIGIPLQNARAFIVDPGMELVPFGVVGEMLLGGESLAQGYWQRPALTAEKFVPDPFSGHRGGRLYKSGDLARLPLDGQIQLLARVDHQVKIRGFRVELGEIETTLTQHPAISEAVVIAEKDEQSGTRLCAHLVLVEGAVLKHADLGAWLSERLPQVMHPAHFSVLRALPLNPNGKVDRSALPPAHAAKGLQSEFVAPANSTETWLCGLWRDLLEVEKIGVTDNFLDLGAHSFLIIRANKKIRECFDRDISTIDLYRYPNVRALARFLDGGGDEGVDKQSVQDRAGRKRQAMTNQRRRQQSKGVSNRGL